MKKVTVIIMSLALAMPMAAAVHAEEDQRSYWRKVNNEIIYIGPKSCNYRHKGRCVSKPFADTNSDKYRCEELGDTEACDRLLDSEDKKPQEGTRLDYRTILDEDLRWLCDNTANEDRQSACDEIARRAAN